MSVVVNLLEDAYTVGESFESSAGPDSGGYYPGRSQDSSYLAVVLFFCTLGEILLEHLVALKTLRLDLPQQLQDRLFADNLGIKSRIDKLFPAMFDGVTFMEALSRVRSSTGIDYKSTVDTYREANSFRNHLLHRGAAWKLDDQLPDRCFAATSDLLAMYAAMHNEMIEQEAPLD